MQLRLVGTVMVVLLAMGTDHSTATATNQQPTSVRVKIDVTAASGSLFNISAYVQERLRMAGIAVTDGCEPCDAKLSVHYAESRGSSFLNGAVFTEIQGAVALARPDGTNLWSERIQVRSPQGVGAKLTSDDLRQTSTDQFKDDLFMYYLGDWILAKLGRVSERIVLQRAVSNASPTSAYSYSAAKQAVQMLRIHGLTAFPALLVALTHPHWDVRADAASVLGDIGDVSVLAPLERLARDDKEELVRKAASDAVSKVRDRRH